MKNAMKDAIKKRRLQIVIQLEPNEEEEILEKEQERPVPMTDGEPEMTYEEETYDDLAPEDPEVLSSGSEVEMDEKDMMRAESIINSGREPKTITERMLVEQYKKLKGV